MGQDNLAKIILALFSFQRLKDQFPNEYEGGILAIDELDATMYPASQVELLKVLRRYASKLGIQIIFTTHSLSLLKEFDRMMSSAQTHPGSSNDLRMLFLERVDNNIDIKQDVGYHAVELNLNVEVEVVEGRRKKITVYTEDAETIVFAKAILKEKCKNLDFINCTFSCSSLIDLVCRKVPAFIRPYSIVILDGDVQANRSNMTKLNRAKADNVLFLPGDKSPERLIAEFMENLSDSDPVWKNVGEGYNKQVCFRNYRIEEINAPGEQSRVKAKDWFNEQLSIWSPSNSRKGTKVIGPFLQSIEAEVKDFRNKFDDILKRFI